ncbi:MAG: tRNA (adenosine(37)-N6)-dimethylallyltransferase MiaA [Chthoniobacterales bacterium]
MNCFVKAKPLFIAGPTGVGKSAFALELALQLDGEVLGADAFQIYQGLPVLTAQPSKKDQAQVPHHLIGVLPLTEVCDAARYQAMAQPIIDQIVARGRVSLITGGTGFYFRSLISPLDPLPGADPELRAAFAPLSLGELVMQLETMDPKILPQLDLKNRRRVERALEIMMQTGRPLSEIWHKKEQESVTGFLLIRDREELYERITNNVREMFDRNVLEEVRALGSIEFSQTAAMTLGLREIQACCRGEKTIQETINLITTATKRYAKRQLTWFKNQHNFVVLNLSHFSSTRQAVKEAINLKTAMDCGKLT